jgi:hypothetical protein
MTEEQQRALARQYYIRQHAPTILAGLAVADATEAQNRELYTGQELSSLRRRAVEQAGLLYDETELPK